ncbi:LOW QUALITY PROTEIN: hypothetical protein CVT26_000383 [Gymnopilus dilepis]|uniref:Tail specific protease domain-containing protein n=1 Tax=Gymnopilus dilepis TaxID=231916 RepID=A0A409VHQ7_9AGAR|nr:LOW QUALITY PROTEIN: hypothetical protein CVT26_000383 [Gymnopilus dilepis]
MVLALREVSRHMVVILSDGAFPDPKDFPNFLKAKVRSKSIADVGSLPVMQFLPIIRGFLVFASCIAAASAIGNHELTERAADPCAVVGGKKWVNPKDLRACFTSVKVDPVQKENIIQVINKTLAFHTSVNYEFKAPEPFTADVHEDLLGDLARIQKQNYASDYDLHIDFSRTLKRLNDGHSLFLNFLPTPLVLLTDSNGAQNVHIAPEAFQVASAEFADETEFWQNALPGSLKGQLASLSGAKVLLINGQDPFVAVDANAQITGSFQGFGTRQNSYNIGSSGWTYIMGNFAQQSLPLSDSATLTIIRNGHVLPEVITIIVNNNADTSCCRTAHDTASWRANFCVAVDGTNGVNLYATNSSTTNSPLIKFQQQPPVPPAVARKQPLDVMLDTTPPSDIVLPPPLQPALPAINGSRSVSQFYMLKDGKTGVMALGSFSDTALNPFLLGMLQGLQSLKALGATQLIVDVSNNGGGFICAAHIAGPNSGAVPQAGLDTKARDGPLAQLITDRIVNDNADPQNLLLYNPTNWANASNVFFAPGTNWLQPPVRTTINGRADAFSQRLGEECPIDQYPAKPPTTALFDPKKVAIVSNGSQNICCSGVNLDMHHLDAQARALYSVTMNKKEGAKTVVVGGKSDVQQQYCGTVGGQSTDFSTIDTEVKSVGLKDNSLAPPDLLVNGVQGITWRLGFGVFDTTQPEEWQSRPATLNLPLTSNMQVLPPFTMPRITDLLITASTIQQPSGKLL